MTYEISVEDDIEAFLSDLPQNTASSPYELLIDMESSTNFPYKIQTIGSESERYVSIKFKPFTNTAEGSAANYFDSDYLVSCDMSDVTFSQTRLLNFGELNNLESIYFGNMVQLRNMNDLCHDCPRLKTVKIKGAPRVDSADSAIFINCPLVETVEFYNVSNIFVLMLNRLTSTTIKNVFFEGYESGDIGFNGSWLTNIESLKVKNTGSIRIFSLNSSQAANLKVLSIEGFRINSNDFTLNTNSPLSEVHWIDCTCFDGVLPVQSYTAFRSTLKKICIKTPMPSISALDLQNYTAIEEIEISWSQINSLTLPSSSPLKKLSITDSDGISTLSVSQFSQTLEFVDLSGCQDIESLDINNFSILEELNLQGLGWNTQCSVSIKNCPSLAKLNLSQSSITSAPDLTTCPLLTDWSGLFERCSSLSIVSIIPNFVTSLNGTFLDCEDLKTVGNIPASVRDMRDCFNGCERLASIDNWLLNVSSLESGKMNNCFTNCKALETINTPLPLDTESLTWHLLHLKAEPNVGQKLYVYNTDGVLEKTVDNISGAVTLQTKSAELCLTDENISDAKRIEFLNSGYHYDKQGLDPLAKNFILWKAPQSKFKTNIPEISEVILPTQSGDTPGYVWID